MNSLFGLFCLVIWFSRNNDRILEIEIVTTSFMINSIFFLGSCPAIVICLWKMPQFVWGVHDDGDHATYRVTPHVALMPHATADHSLFVKIKRSIDLFIPPCSKKCFDAPAYKKIMGRYIEVKAFGPWMAWFLVLFGWSWKLALYLWLDLQEFQFPMVILVDRSMLCSWFFFAVLNI